MRLLFDQGTPAGLRRHLSGQTVDTAAGRGWSNLDNGDLLDRAEDAGYAVLVTTDQSVRHQQNLRGRRLAIVVLLAPAWPRVKLRIDAIRAAVREARPGHVTEVPDLRKGTA